LRYRKRSAESDTGWEAQRVESTFLKNQPAGPLNAAARPALEYYFNEAPPLAPVGPAWNLLQLLGWLHGVLRFVVWEERARASTRRETPALAEDLFDVAELAPNQLEQ
jgi:hypothetical protein